jgi:tetratricopeptide (TPR) repeat protein
MKGLRAILLLLLLLAGGFTTGTMLQRRTLKWTNRSASDSVLKLLFGDSRRLFANQFFVKADISFHSGYYPSIFDQARRMEEEENAVAHEGEHKHEGEHEEEAGFLGPPTDWIDRFGRHFRVTEHTHLQGGNIREILPWLRISADLDPQRVETYTVAAYWLRSQLGNVKEAEDFLREGLRANPDSYEILIELGNIYNENYHAAARARNIWELAVQKWEHQKHDAKDKVALDQYDKLLTRLSRLEENQGNYPKAAKYLEQILARDASPNPDIVRKQIDELKQKASTSRASPAPSHE